jgi:proteic killer suppression protein
VERAEEGGAHRQRSSQPSLIGETKKTQENALKERNTRDARHLPKALWRVVQRKLKMFDVAVRVDDLESPPGNRLKPLKRQMRGRYSVRVNEQSRVTFRWEDGHASKVAVGSRTSDRDATNRGGR